MKLRSILPGVFIAFGCAFTGLAADTSNTVIQPIALTGWNADVVFENRNSPSSTSFDRPTQRTNDYPLYAWFESGLDGHSDGLPASRRITSAANSAVVFELQPYTTNNVMLLSAAKPSGTLTLTEPSVYPSLFILVAAGGGDSELTLQARFADDTQSEPVPFRAPDWWTSFESQGAKTPAVTGLGRSNGQEEFQYEEHGDDGFALYQVEVDLKKLRLDSKPIKSVTFKKGRGGATAGIFAISGEKTER